MKKFIVFCLMAFMVCSCAVTNTITETYYGCVTTFTPQGDTLKVWNNALIEEETKEVSTMYGTTSYQSTSAFKYFGLNFIDLNTGKGVVIHSGIPYIIEYNTDITISSDKSNTPVKSETDIRAEELETKHKIYQKQIEENKKELKKLDRNSAEYVIKKEQNDKLKAEMNKLEREYVSLTGQYMYGYVDNIYN